MNTLEKSVVQMVREMSDEELANLIRSYIGRRLEDLNTLPVVAKEPASELEKSKPKKKKKKRRAPRKVTETKHPPQLVIRGVRHHVQFVNGVECLAWVSRGRSYVQDAKTRRGRLSPWIKTSGDTNIEARLKFKDILREKSAFWEP